MKTETVHTLIDMVTEANPGRGKNNLNRRVNKLFEEIGEIEEAWLQITSATNHKNMSKADVREEACDVLIVALDITLTPLASRFDAARFDWTPYEKHGLDEWYDTIIWEIAKNASHFAMARNVDELVAHRHSNIMARFAFSLVNLIFEGDEDAIIAEVVRKLAKWDMQRRKNMVVTDAE